jgi:hypothetical protein
MTPPAGPSAPVWGRDDLTCPLTAQRVRQLHQHALNHPWPGDEPLTCPAHRVGTTAITEPGRPTRLIYSLDVGYHASGWFANSDYEKCLHLSLSHPRREIPKLYVNPASIAPGRHVGVDLETPTDDEARAWGRVLFGRHASLSWFEPAATTLDPYRMPNVVHLRLYLNKDNEPIMPIGEVYDLRPWDDGTSPRKITEGRAGADVR